MPIPIIILPKCQPGLNPDSWIDPDLDPDVRQIAAKLQPIYSLLGVGHFAKFCEKWPVNG